MAYNITDACVACGSCAEQCPVEAISEGDGKYEINPDICVSWLLRRAVPRRSHRGSVIYLQTQDLPAQSLRRQVLLENRESV